MTPEERREGESEVSWKLRTDPDYRQRFDQVGKELREAVEHLVNDGPDFTTEDIIKMRNTPIA